MQPFDHRGAPFCGLQVRGEHRDGDPGSLAHLRRQGAKPVATTGHDGQRVTACPKLTDELMDRGVEGTTDQQGEHSIKQLERYRDDCITSVMTAIAEAKSRHGIAN